MEEQGGPGRFGLMEDFAGSECGMGEFGRIELRRSDSHGKGRGLGRGCGRRHAATAKLR